MFCKKLSNTHETNLKFFCISIFFSKLSKAQTNSIKGKIVTTDSKPAAFVNVTLKNTKQVAVTNENGAYSIVNITPASYILMVSFIGLQTVSQQINVKANSILEVNFAVNETLVELDEVIIKSRKNLNAKPVTIGRVGFNPLDLPQGITVVGQTVLKDQQAQRLSDVLKNVNGVYLASNVVLNKKTLLHVATFFLVLICLKIGCVSIQVPCPK